MFEWLIYTFPYRPLSPRIISYMEPKGVESFTANGSVQKTGGSVTYGPYTDLAASVISSFSDNYQQVVTVHYYHEQPVLQLTKLERSAEISHWGANLNVEDKIVLYNAGPKLVFSKSLSGT